MLALSNEDLICQNVMMKLHTRNTAEKLLGWALGAVSVFLFFTMASVLPAEPQDLWNCEETAYYSVYEDISRTEGKGRSNTKSLKWIDADTIGFESITLKRIDLNSETFFSQSSGSSLQIIQTEKPHLVVLAQPQVWMNKFGNLRVRFYRCTP